MTPERMLIRHRPDHAIATVLAFRSQPFTVAEIVREAMPIFKQDMLALDDIWAYEHANSWLYGQSVAGFLRRVRGVNPDAMARYEAQPSVWALTPGGMATIRLAIDAYAQPVLGSEATGAVDVPAQTTDRRSLMREATQAKVFIEGKAKPLHMGGDPEGAFRNAKLQLAESTLIDGVTTDGNPIAIPTAVVTSIEGVSDQRKPDSAIMVGRAVRVRSAYAMRGNTPEDDAILDAIPESRVSFAVWVEAEDLASATVLVFDLETGKRYWVNPASPERSIDLAQQAAYLLALGETLLVDAYDPDHGGTPDGDPNPTNGLTEDQRNAIAWLEQKGTIEAATSIAEREFVEAWLDECASSGTVQVVTTDEHFATITAVKDGVFTVEAPGYSNAVTLDGIERIVSIDGQPTA